MPDERDVPDEQDAATGAPRWLIGRWRLLRADAALDFGPGVAMDFRVGGELIYTLDVGGRDRDVSLVYRAAGNTLSTENPAVPHSVSTHFERGAGGVLVLDFAGARAWFVREELARPR